MVIRNGRFSDSILEVLPTAVSPMRRSSLKLGMSIRKIFAKQNGTYLPKYEGCLFQRYKPGMTVYRTPLFDGWHDALMDVTNTLMSYINDPDTIPNQPAKRKPR